MKLTIKTKLILFALGAYYNIMNSKLKDRNLVVSLSKVDFIRLVMNSGVVEKQPRSLYKNLETLENNRYITYDNKSLIFTEKGRKKFNQIEHELMPYFKIINTIKAEDVARYAKRPQTAFNV